MTNLASLVDPIPAPLRALADLFAEALADVKFPDIDAARLTDGVARVQAQQTEVTRLEGELAHARALLDASRDELTRNAARAHAYARVYAEDNGALQSRIDAITLPRARTRATATATVTAPTTATAEATVHRGVPVDGAAARKLRRKGARDEAPSQLFEDISPGAGADAAG